MDAIIFDVDGTLWDSRADVADSWQLLCKSRGIPAAHVTCERLTSEFGKPMAAIGLSLFPDLKKEELDSLLKDMCDFEVEYLKTHSPDVYPGVRELFSGIYDRGIPIFIVSNCQAGYIEVLLDSSHLAGFVTAHLCPDDTSMGKAENIRKLMADYQLSSPVYVGDTELDREAAFAAGAGFIHAAYGFGELKEAAPAIKKPLDLLSLL